MPEHGRRSVLADALEWIVIVAVAVSCALGIRAYVAEVYEVPSGSMLETIQLGDRVLGEKVTYRTGSPEQGDIVTFGDPEDSATTLIKRVVAVGGQTVDIEDGSVYVDGVRLDEPYVLGKKTYQLEEHSSNLSSDITYPYTVPEGCVWVMGDNRTNSLDSRYFGAVSVSDVSSKALCIFWPLQDATMF